MAGVTTVCAANAIGCAETLDVAAYGGGRESKVIGNGRANHLFLEPSRTRVQGRGGSDQIVAQGLVLGRGAHVTK